MEITTSKIGKQTLKESIEFLEKIWSSKEVDLFLQDVENVIFELKNNRHLKYPKFYKNIRSVLIAKRHVRMFFKVEKAQITILLFFDMRQDYKKIKDFLNQTI